MSDPQFLVAVFLAHITGTLNGLAIGLWIGEKVGRRSER